MYFRILTVSKVITLLGALVVAASGCGEETRTRADAGAIDAGALADGQVGCNGCTDDDGCCGTGCTADVDNDCPADGVCGDGVLDPGETCDPPGSCPTTCDDGLGCTADITTGAAGTCDLACESTAIVDCVSGDGCCAPGCDMAVDDDCLPFVLDPDFATLYELRDLGSVPGVPPSYGGLVIDPAAPDTLLIGGAANTASGALYAIGLERDELGHVIGWVGTATQIALAASNDGGVAFGPDGVLFLTRYPVDALAQMRPGSADADKVTDLTALGVVASPGGMAFAPPDHPGAGRAKLVSWPGGQWYDLTLAADGAGLFDVIAATQMATLPGGPEGIAYVPLGSPLFPAPSVLISEYSANEVAVYETDAQGDPVLASRRTFITGLVGAEGALIDPASGDFLFSTFGGGDRVVAVRGFAP